MDNKLDACVTIAPAQVWCAAETLSPRIKKLRDEYWAFYDRDFTNEVRS